MCGVYPAADVKTAGDQISSTYEGRHVTLRDDELLHKYTGATDDGFVDKGDAVIFCKAGNGTSGRGVGVALNDGAASADLITVDTEGIWALLVYADDDAGGSEVVPGDALFIDTSTAQEGAAGVGIGCLSKRRNLVTQIPFGYALGNIDSAGEGVIAVKVHWDPEEQQDEYIAFADGHAADNAKSFIVTDADDNASGTSRGLYISYTTSVAKTGSAAIRGAAIDIAVGEDCPSAYGLSLYSATIADKTVGQLTGLSIYWEGHGNALTHSVMIDLGKNTDHEPLDRNCYIRFREHTAVYGSIFRFEGGNAASLFITFDNPAGAEDAAVILDTATCDQTADYRIRCHLEQYAIDRYIYLYPV